MDLLPSELKLAICYHTRGVSVSDLASLSLTGRTWRQLALPLLFEGLRITYRNSSYYGRLHHLVAKLQRGAEPLPFLKYVRRLEFLCLQDHLDYTKEKQRLNKVKEWGPYLIRYNQPATQDGFLEQHLQDLFSARPLIFHEQGMDMVGELDWEALVLLISLLTRLEEFTYSALNQFPDWLHDALMKHRPNCRLNILGAQPLDSGCANWTAKPLSLDLLFSNNLRTFAAQFPFAVDFMPPGAHGDYSIEVLRFLFASPSLKHLILEPLNNVLSLNAFRRKWREAADSIEPVLVAQLESLSFKGWGPWENVIYDLADMLDISSLRSLEIPFQHNDTRFFHVAPKLINLERLFATFGCGRGHGRIGAEDPENSISALLALQPLQYLSIRGLRSVHSLNRLLGRHGEALRGLILEPDCPPWSCAPFAQGPGGDLYPILESTDIKHIAQACPKLHELRLQLRRYEGTLRECESYRAFRHFRALSTLVLDLDCDPRDRPINHDPIPGRNALSNNILRSAFINAATDESLVRGIWSLLATPTLKTLRIAPFGYLDFPTTSHDIFRIVAKPFILTRVFGTTEPNIEELARLAGDVWTDNSRIPNWRMHVYPGAKSVYQRIWPRTGVIDDWVWDWKSFPLRADG
ncbi:hypothetical protein BJY01DRAFT_211604 [Aspergillus pseudoustus]|uniref:F-box domain-containing protein n=1 Tax=Aspergillus pseudoustus TaxID=1810923 RepID=A0ABR4K9T9_9EURO